MRPPLLRLACCLLLSLLVAACGGGGSGPLAVNYDARQAWRNLLAANGGFTVAGVGSDGIGYELDVTLASAPPAVYPLTGELGLRALQTTTLVRNGIADPSTTTTDFYDPAGPTLFGVSSSDGGCATVTALGALPQSTPLGTRGPLYDADSFDRCTAGAAFVGTVISDWSIEAEGDIVFFCITSVQRNLGGQSVASQSNCVEIFPDGGIGSFARVSVVIAPGPSAPGGFTLVARNY